MITSARAGTLRTFILAARRPKSLPRRTIQHRAWSPESPSPPCVFAFDIDGVLIRGPQTIPAARRALDVLNGNNHTGRRIPFILLTNGGGTSEGARAQKLSEQLGVEIQVNQIIQAHTVLKSLLHKYAHRPVLVLGGRNDTVRKVAEGYGFQHVCTTLDVLAWKPEVWPFHTLTPEEHASTKLVDFSRLQFAAIFVFHDPRNWALDTQVALDVVRAGGVLGAPYRDDFARPSSAGMSADNAPVELVFCNPDLIWTNDFPRPRLGQGAFREAFMAVCKAATGAYYPHTQYGKPTRATYDFAKSVLKERMEETLGKGLSGDIEMPKVYMVGDNPESDIAGANAAGWDSVLVETGVYDPARGAPAHAPTYIASDVEAAVRWAIARHVPVP